MSEILIVGTGAMACLFAARLASHVKVTLLGTWTEGLQALERNGVRLIESDGTEGVFPVEATSDPAECSICTGTRQVLADIASGRSACDLPGG
jgi:ketopantoate reductase